MLSLASKSAQCIICQPSHCHFTSQQLPDAFDGDTLPIVSHMLNSSARLPSPKATTMFACQQPMSLLAVPDCYSRPNAADALCAREKSQTKRLRPPTRATSSLSTRKTFKAFRIPLHFVACLAWPCSDVNKRALCWTTLR